MSTATRRWRRDHGLYIVEFALVAAVFMFMVFGAIEVSRLLFTWSALDAITQRGARVAAVCQQNHPSIVQYALFGDSGDSPVVPELGTENIGIVYLDEDGAAAGGGTRPSYVRVSIVGYQHRVLIPELVAGFVSPLLDAPTFSTTRPAESLGRNPDTGNDGCF